MLRGVGLESHSVERFDGQMIWIGGEVTFELGNYLGGGAAGVVYEGVDLRVRTKHTMRFHQRERARVRCHRLRATWR